jgi:hypothetical protein
MLFAKPPTGRIGRVRDIRRRSGHPLPQDVDAVKKRRRARRESNTPAEARAMIDARVAALAAQHEENLARERLGLETLDLQQTGDLFSDDPPAELQPALASLTAPKSRWAGVFDQEGAEP